MAKAKTEIKETKSVADDKKSEFQGKKLTEKQRQEIIKEYEKVVIKLKELDLHNKFGSKFNYTFSGLKYFKTLNGKTLHSDANEEEAKKDTSQIEKDMAWAQLDGVANVSYDKVMSLLKPAQRERFLEYCKTRVDLARDLVGMAMFAECIKKRNYRMAQAYCAYFDIKDRIPMIEEFFDVVISADVIKDVEEFYEATVGMSAAERKELVADTVVRKKTTSSDVLSHAITSGLAGKEYDPLLATTVENVKVEALPKYKSSRPTWVPEYMNPPLTDPEIKRVEDRTAVKIDSFGKESKEILSGLTRGTSIIYEIEEEREKRSRYNSKHANHKTKEESDAIRDKSTVMADTARSKIKLEVEAMVADKMSSKRISADAYSKVEDRAVIEASLARTEENRKTIDRCDARLLELKAAGLEDSIEFFEVKAEMEEAVHDNMEQMALRKSKGYLMGSGGYLVEESRIQKINKQNIEELIAKIKKQEDEFAAKGVSETDPEFLAVMDTLYQELKVKLQSYKPEKILSDEQEKEIIAMNEYKPESKLETAKMELGAARYSLEKMKTIYSQMLADSAPPEETIKVVGIIAKAEARLKKAEKEVEEIQASLSSEKVEDAETADMTELAEKPLETADTVENAPAERDVTIDTETPVEKGLTETTDGSDSTTRPQIIDLSEPTVDGTYTFRGIVNGLDKGIVTLDDATKAGTIYDVVIRRLRIDAGRIKDLLKLHPEEARPEMRAEFEAKLAEYRAKIESMSVDEGKKQEWLAWVDKAEKRLNAPDERSPEQQQSSAKNDMRNRFMSAVKKRDYSAITQLTSQEEFRKVMSQQETFELVMREVPEEEVEKIISSIIYSDTYRQAHAIEFKKIEDIAHFSSGDISIWNGNDYLETLKLACQTHSGELNGVSILSNVKTDNHRPSASNIDVSGFTNRVETDPGAFTKLQKPIVTFDEKSKPKTPVPRYVLDEAAVAKWSARVSSIVATQGAAMQTSSQEASPDAHEEARVAAVEATAETSEVSASSAPEESVAEKVQEEAPLGDGLMIVEVEKGAKPPKGKGKPENEQGKDPKNPNGPQGPGSGA